MLGWKKIINRKNFLPRVIWFYKWCLYVINHHLINFGVHKTCWIGDITFIICQEATSQQTFVLMKTYWRRLQNIVARRLLEDVLKTSSVRLHQDEFLLRCSLLTNNKRNISNSTSPYFIFIICAQTLTKILKIKISVEFLFLL